MSRQHAIIQKKVINLDHAGDRHVMCAWDDCERDGYELYKIRVNEAAYGPPRMYNYVFCTERHKQFFLHSAKAYGKLPPGYRRSTI